MNSGYDYGGSDSGSAGHGDGDMGGARHSDGDEGRATHTRDGDSGYILLMIWELQKHLFWHDRHLMEC